MAKLSDSDYLRLAAPLSEVDRKIVSILQTDGREPYTELARKIGVTEKTIRNRVRQLLDDGVIQITAVTDPGALGYNACAMLAITTDPRVPATKVAEALREISSVDYVVVSAGRFTILAELLCSDTAEMQATLETKIGIVRGVRSIEVMPYLSLHYQNARFAPSQNTQESNIGVGASELDETDKKIVRALSRDGRVPFQQIADVLGISEGQVRARYKHMLDSKILNVIALINPMGLEFRSMALLGLRAAPGHQIVQLAEAIARLPNTTYVAICGGRYDILAEVVCTSEKELLGVLDNDIRRWNSAEKVETFLYLNLHYKRRTPIRDNS